MHPNLPDNSYLMPNGLHAVSVNPSTWFGSNAYNVLIPALSCNPLKGLTLKGQRFNPACFTTPAYGQQGPNVMPYIREPNYWNSDLGVYKSFPIKESQRIELRVSATNWLNHPGKALQVTSISPTNTNTLTTGVPAFKTGSRFVTLALKYYF
jgi:hypothetical protein